MEKYLVSLDNAVNKHLLGFFVSEPDDAIALALLLDAHLHNELEITGLIASSGNTDSDYSYEATSKMVKMAGLDIPVIKGKGKTMKSDMVDYQAIRHVIDLATMKNEKTNLIGLGPVTDFAHLFRRYPSLAQRIGSTLFVNTSFVDTSVLKHFLSFNDILDRESAIFIEHLFGYKHKFNNSIFGFSISDKDIDRMSKNLHPLMIYVTENLKTWNLENKGFPIPGVIERKGDMCPWDMIWVATILEPKQFDHIRVGNKTVFSIHNNEELMDKLLTRLERF